MNSLLDKPNAKPSGFDATPLGIGESSSEKSTAGAVTKPDSIQKHSPPTSDTSTACIGDELTLTDDLSHSDMEIDQEAEEAIWRLCIRLERRFLSSWPNG